MSTLKVNNLIPRTGSGVHMAGHVIQLLSTTKTDVFAFNNNVVQAIPGLSVIITPKFATSKIYITADVVGSVPTTSRGFMGLYRGGSILLQGDAAGSRIRAAAQLANDNAGEGISSTISYLDSPNSTSALTYQIYGINEGGQYTSILINRSPDDGDNASRGRFVSTITAMEVAQ